MKHHFLLILLIIFSCASISADPLTKQDAKHAKYLIIKKGIDLNKAKERLRKIIGKNVSFPLKKCKIVVYKSKNILELWQANKLLKSYKVGIGQSPIGHKQIKGDNKTPEGRYHLVTKNPYSDWHIFMGINYPNTKDGKAAYKDGRINKKTYLKIKKKERIKSIPPWNSVLGGAVGLHGPYNDENWTWGCVGLLPKDIEELWVSVKYWTPVVIYP